MESHGEPGGKKKGGGSFCQSKKGTRSQNSKGSDRHSIEPDWGGNIGTSHELIARCKVWIITVYDGFEVQQPCLASPLLATNTASRREWVRVGEGLASGGGREGERHEGEMRCVGEDVISDTRVFIASVCLFGLQTRPHTITSEIWLSTGRIEFFFGRDVPREPR